MFVERAQKVHFNSGALTLEGCLTGKPAPGGVGLVVCHPHPLYGGNMKNLVVAKMADAFAAKGMAALRFNFRGVGRSQGSYEGGNGEPGDVAAALDYMTGELGLARVHVAGYSFGSAMMMKNSETDDRAASLIAIAPPIDTMEVSRGNPAAALPKLVFAGTRDEHCTLKSLADWYEPLTGQKRLIVVDEADHFFAGREMEMGEAAAAFALETAARPNSRAP